MNVADGLKSFGITSRSQHLLIVRVDSPALDRDAVQRDMDAVVGSGHLANLELLGDDALCDWRGLAKASSAR